MATNPAQAYNLDRESAIEQRRFGPAWLWIAIAIAGTGGLTLGGSSYYSTAQIAERVARLEATVEASSGGTDRRLDVIERKLDQLLGWRAIDANKQP